MWNCDVHSDKWLGTMHWRIVDSRQNTVWHVATRYDVRKGDITFKSCVIMNQWGLILWWIRSIARHILPQSWMILLAISACRSYRESNIIGCRYGFTTQHLKGKTPSIPWNSGMASIAFWSLRFWTATEESQMTGYRTISQIGLGDISIIIYVWWYFNFGI